MMKRSCRKRGLSVLMCRESGLDVQRIRARMPLRSRRIRGGSGVGGSQGNRAR